jgi:hypothetical protein
MLAKIAVVSPADYQKWLAGDDVTIPGVTADDAASQ